MEKPAAIFFDWDGTLVDSYDFLEKAHNHVRGCLDLAPLKDGEFRNHFGRPREELYADLYGHQVKKAQTHFEEFYINNHKHFINVLPGAQNLLETIKSLGIVMGVITNKKADFVKEEIQYLGWETFFTTVVGSGMTPEDKPAAAPLEYAIQVSGIEDRKRDVWLVGDTENDLLCAQNAGCRGVFIGPEDKYRVLKKTCIIYLSFKNCDSLSEFLLQYAEK